MTFTFDDTVITAVLAHMNGDHTDDNLTIARAYGAPDATAVTMTGFDGDGTDWRAETPDGVQTLRIAWPDGPISERPAVRKQVVALYLAACAELGITPGAHEA